MSTEPNAAGASPASTPTPAAPAPAPAPAAAPAATPAPNPAPVPVAPNARDIAAALTQAERKQLVTGQKTLSQIAAARPPKSGAAAPAPTAPTAPAANPEPSLTPEPTAAPAPAAPATPEAAATPEPAAVPPVESEDGEDPATPGDPNAAKTPDRFRFKNPEDQTIALIAKTKGISLREAAALYAGMQPAAPAVPAAPATREIDPGLAHFDQELTDLNTQLTQLTDQRKKAREDVDLEKADSLTDQIVELRTKIGLKQNAREGYIRTSEQSHQQAIEQQTNESATRFLADYPDLQAVGSLPRLAFDQFVAQAMSDPARAHEFTDPNWPEKLGAQFAATHKLTKKTAGAAPTPAATSPSPGPTPAVTPRPQNPAQRPKPLQVPGAKTLTSADGGNPSAPAKTSADLKADLARMSPEQRKRLATKAEQARTT